MTPLRQRMLEDMQIRNLAPATQRSYLEHVARFARHSGRSPALLGPEDIRAYLVYLTTERHLAPSTIIIAVAALRFLDTVTLQEPWSVAAVIPAPKTPRTLPGERVTEGMWRNQFGNATAPMGLPAARSRQRRW